MLLTATALVGGIVGVGMAVRRAQHPKPTLATILGPMTVGPPIYHVRRPPLSPRLLVIGGLTTAGTALLVASARGYTPLVLAGRLATALQSSRYGPLLYVVADTLRPLTLFPDSLMTLTSGLIFGPVQGFVLSYIGFGTAAVVAHRVGRTLRGSPPLVSQLNVTDERYASAAMQSTTGFSGVRHLLARYGKKMQEHPFAAMVIMHGMFIETDAVNFLAGYLDLPLRPFLAGSMLGIALPMMTTVLAGGSLYGSLAAGALQLNPAVLAASGMVLMGSVSVAWYLQQRDTVTAQ